MATAVNKQKTLDHVYAALKKRFDAPDPTQRNILEHLLYAVVREGTTRERADRAFQNLKTRFVDWNEVRVSTVQELCDAMGPLPDVATMTEAGYPYIEGDTWVGILAPAATDTHIVTLLYREIVGILNMPATRERLVELGYEPVGSTPDEFVAQITTEFSKWAEVIRAAGIRAH